MFSYLFIENIEKRIGRLVANINKRCRKYEKNINTKSHPINTIYQNAVFVASIDTLNQMKLTWEPTACENMSDCGFEWDSGILQLDAKVCLNTERREFEFREDGNIKIHCGIAQTSLESSFNNRKGVQQVIKGLQLPEIDSKPVYTMVSFMRWGYSELEGYYVDSYGLCLVPHTNEFVEFPAAKSEREMRIVLKNPALWKIVQVSSASSPQTQGSVPSEGSESQDVEQLDL